MTYPERERKLTDLVQLIARVPDGCRIAFGGFPMFGKPTAAVHELIRQHKRNLTVVGTSNGIDVDLLAAAGAISRLETAYVGLEEFGLAPSFRRAAEQGQFEIVDYSEGVAFDRFRASQEGLTFLATAQLAGTDMATDNPDVRPFECPITGTPYHAVPAANVDVAVVHAPAADEFGNVLYPQSRMLPQGLDLTMACGTGQVLVTVERIVEHAYVLRHPELTQIPAFRTTAVAHVPWGAHPTAMPGFYEVDHEYVESVYVPASASATAMERFLTEEIVGDGSHDGYLGRVGAARLMRLERWGMIS
jgi:glutaconate CoA-transferase subunit A